MSAHRAVAVAQSRPDYRPMAQDQRPPWEIPTPTSLRREAREREAQRMRERMRISRRTLTPEELRQVAALSQAGRLTLVDQVHRDDDAGLDCACVVGMHQEIQRCVAHRRIGHNRWARPR